MPTEKDKPKSSIELQIIKEFIELVELYGDNLKNMDPEQLKILELDFLECFRKIRGNQ